MTLTPDLTLVRAHLTTTAILWSARRGTLDHDWRARLRHEVITPAPPAADAPACRRCVPRPTPQPAVAVAAIDALRSHADALCTLAAVLEITAPDRPVAAWEPAADVGWRTALSAWRTDMLASHLAVARVVRRRAHAAVRSTSAAAVWESTGIDLTADRDQIELHWRLGLHDGRAGVGDDDTWRSWLAARLPHWRDRTRADAHTLAMMDPDQPLWTPVAADGAWASAGIGGGRLPAAWTRPAQQMGDRA